MLDFQSIHTDFTSDVDDDKNVVRRQRAVFPRKVRKADVVIKGVRMEYDNGDHHVLLEQAGVENVFVEDKSVFFDVFLGLRDDSKNPYSGAVMALVIVDLI